MVVIVTEAEFKAHTLIRKEVADGHLLLLLRSCEPQTSAMCTFNLSSRIAAVLCVRVCVRQSGQALLTHDCGFVLVDARVR